MLKLFQQFFLQRVGALFLILENLKQYVTDFLLRFHQWKALCDD